MSVLRKGMRVVTPRGGGYVVYVRMAPPTYAQPEAVSVLLDAVDRPGYSGTIFAAEQVSAE